MKIHEEALEQIRDFEPRRPLGFGKIMAPALVRRYYHDGSWQPMELVPYHKLQLDPATNVLHYGQEIFEGLKAYRQSNGAVNLFRPEYNAGRFRTSARRMAMAELPEEDFVEAVDLMADVCRNFIPDELGESLYLRPFMFSVEEGLGVKPASDYLFMVIASPSGSYFTGASVKVYIERDDSRAAQGGIGFAKTGGNYAASLRSGQRTRQHGCEQTLWLDACEKRYVQESSGMNFFAVVDGELITPPTNDTIFNGCTRDSIIKLAGHMGYTCHERQIDIGDLLGWIEKGRCTEAFLCGTAAIVTPVESLTDKDDSILRLPEPDGNISMKLRSRLLNIQHGESEDPEGWIYRVEDKTL